MPDEHGKKADAPTPLARRIGFPLLTCYGLGTILGAGIYVLVGKVAGESGLLAPLAFLLAAFIASITALSYCQLVYLFPKSAGEAIYVEAGFSRAGLTKAVGYMVLVTGIVSAATLVNGFLGYLTTFLSVPQTVGVLLVVCVIGALAFSGIAESLWVAGLITVLEVLGLVVVLILAGDSLQHVPAQFPSLFFPGSVEACFGVITGAFLAFYAFIGFEDMVNVVEEVKEPAKNMHRAILVALVVSTLLYVLVALIAVLSMPIDELAASEAPIRDLLQTNHPNFAISLAVISLLAIINGVLAQIIMGSRILYGMSVQDRAPSIFGAVSKRTRVPSVATLFVCVLTAFFAIWLPLEQLAKLTSFVILSIFALVNISLWKLKKTRKADLAQMPDKIPSAPKLGAALCIGFILLQLFSLI